jgi:hypothetical protein
MEAFGPKPQIGMAKKKGRPGSDTPVARPGRPALRITSEPDQAGTRLTEKRCDRSITFIQHGCLINAVAAIFEGGREGACLRRIESLPRVAVGYQLKGDDHDKCPQHHIGANLQALFIGECDMRKRRSHNARCSQPARTSRQNRADCSQVPGHAKGRAEVQQLQAFHGAKRLPDGRWNRQSGRLVHDLSEGLTQCDELLLLRLA